MSAAPSANHPGTTRAIRIEQPGGPEAMRLVDVPIGEPGPGEIRIRHHACGLNFIDVYHRTGLYPLPLPASLGMEAAGVVEAVGEGLPGQPTHLRVGDMFIAQFIFGVLLWGGLYLREVRLRALIPFRQ